MFVPPGKEQPLTRQHIAFGFKNSGCLVQVTTPLRPFFFLCRAPKALTERSICHFCVVLLNAQFSVRVRQLSQVLRR